MASPFLIQPLLPFGRPPRSHFFSRPHVEVRGACMPCSVQLLLLVGLDRAVGRRVGDAGEDKALASLVVVKEGLVALVDGAGEDDARAGGAGARPAGVGQVDAGLLGGVQDVDVVCAWKRKRGAGGESEEACWLERAPESRVVAASPPPRPFSPLPDPLILGSPRAAAGAAYRPASPPGKASGSTCMHSGGHAPNARPQPPGRTCGVAALERATDLRSPGALLLLLQKAGPRRSPLPSCPQSRRAGSGSPAHRGGLRGGEGRGRGAEGGERPRPRCLTAAARLSLGCRRSRRRAQSPVRARGGTS